MSKFCPDCGKEIIVGTTCMDCVKNVQEEREAQNKFDKSLSSIDYKKLVVRMCLVVAILVASVGYAWITDNSESQEDVDKNTNSYSSANKTDGYNDYGNKSGKSQENYSTLKIGGKATDFEVVGGSDIVYVISEKNYGVICPHCGYDMGACGTSSIWAEMSMYRAGETASILRWTMCASKFQGGCRKDFKYTVTIKFK